MTWAIGGAGPLARSLRALGPVAGGIVLDLADVASFGPVGLFTGFGIGGLLGWYLSGVYGYASSTRPLAALAAAVYCAIPMTEPLPLATILSVMSMLAPDGNRKGNEKGNGNRDRIDRSRRPLSNGMSCDSEIGGVAPDEDRKLTLWMGCWRSDQLARRRADHRTGPVRSELHDVRLARLVR